jgi:hypothetical protein
VSDETPKAQVKAGGKAQAKDDVPDVRTAFINCTRYLDPLTASERRRVLAQLQFWYREDTEEVKSGT